MSKPSYPRPYSISSSFPASESFTTRTHVARRRSVPASASSSPPSTTTHPSGPSSPRALISLPPPPPPYVFGPSAGDGNAAGGDRGNRKAWSFPNLTATVEVPVVMGADSWPPLAESVYRASARSSASGSPKALSDRSSTSTASCSKSDGSSSSSSSLSNQGPGTSQRRCHDFSAMPRVADERRKELSSVRPANEGNSDQNRHGNTKSAVQIQVVNHHRRGISRGNQRGGGGGGRGRGDGSGRAGGSAHNWRHGNRHGDDQRVPYWNGRNPPVRMPIPQPFVPPYPLIFPPPLPPVFFPVPPHVPPFMSPLAFPDMDPSPPYRPPGPPPLETLKQMPFIGPQVPPEVPLALLFPQVPQPRPKLKEQIEYYFSDENLCKDVFLRKHMDDQGWVPVSLIATFNRVRTLTTNVQYILNVLQDSKVVEVQGAKIRRRDKWMNWLLPSAQTHSELTGNKPGSANQNSSNQTIVTQDSKLSQHTSCPPAQ